MKNPSALFSTVSRTNHLGFWANQILDPKSVVDFLELPKREVARIARVAESSVRFDEKIPKEVLDRIQEIANVCSLVAEFFGGDAAKTALWFKTPNPQFGNLSPRDMIRYGRYKKLLQYVIAAMEANRAMPATTSVTHGSTPLAAHAT